MQVKVEIVDAWVMPTWIFVALGLATIDLLALILLAF